MPWTAAARGVSRLDILNYISHGVSKFRTAWSIPPILRRAGRERARKGPPRAIRWRVLHQP